ISMAGGVAGAQEPVRASFEFPVSSLKFTSQPARTAEAVLFSRERVADGKTGFTRRTRWSHEGRDGKQVLRDDETVAQNDTPKPGFTFQLSRFEFEKRSQEPTAEARSFDSPAVAGSLRMTTWRYSQKWSFEETVPGADVPRRFASQ